MKQIKGHTKETHIRSAEENGGYAEDYASLEEAAEELAFIAECSVEEAKDRVTASSNCDWILMDDGSVVRLKYPAAEETLKDRRRGQVLEIFHKENLKVL